MRRPIGITSLAIVVSALSLLALLIAIGALLGRRNAAELVTGVAGILVCGMGAFTVRQLWRLAPSAARWLFFWWSTYVVLGLVPPMFAPPVTSAAEVWTVIVVGAVLLVAVSWPVTRYVVLRTRTSRPNVALQLTSE